MTPRILSAFTLLTISISSGCDTMKVTNWVIDLDDDCDGFYTVQRPREFWKEYEKHHCDSESDDYPEGRRVADVAHGWCIIAHCDADLLLMDPDIEPCDALPGCCGADSNDYEFCDDTEPIPFR